VKADAVDSPATGDYVTRFLSGGPPLLADDEDPDEMEGAEIPHEGDEMGRPVPGGEETWSPTAAEAPADYEMWDPENPADEFHPDDDMEGPADEVPHGDEMEGPAGEAHHDEMGHDADEEGEPIEITVETADLEVEGLAPPLPPPDAAPSDVEDVEPELPPHLAEIPVPPPVPASRLLMQPPAPPHGSILAFFVFFTSGLEWVGML